VPGGNGYACIKTRGTLASPTAVLNNDVMLNIRMLGHDGTSNGIGAEIRTFADENWSVGNHGTRIEFRAQGIGEAKSEADVRNINNSNITNCFNLNTEEIDVVSLQVGGASNPNRYLFPTDKGAPNSTFRFDASQGVEFVQNAYSETYFFDNASITSQSPTDTYIAVAGARTSGLNSLFTPGGTLITYTGTKTRTFKACINVSWIAGSNSNEVYKLALFKNGVLVNSSQIASMLDNATSGFPRNATSECLVQLSQNDTLEARVKNTQSTQSVVVKDMNMNVVEIF
jgi:hypothetical protein